jgi:hypothetical protein
MAGHFLIKKCLTYIHIYVILQWERIIRLVMTNSMVDPIRSKIVKENEKRVLTNRCKCI